MGVFRFEIGANILVRKYGWDADKDSIEVKILAKVPNNIKVEVMSEGWFKIGEICWLSGQTWFSYGRAN